MIDTSYTHVEWEILFQCDFKLGTIPNLVMLSRNRESLSFRDMIFRHLTLFSDILLVEPLFVSFSLSTCVMTVPLALSEDYLRLYFLAVRCGLTTFVYYHYKHIPSLSQNGRELQEQTWRYSFYYPKSVLSTSVCR